MDNKNKVNVNFHETFNPDFEYISKIIQIADNYEDLTKEDISELTGIPTGIKSGKVEPHINYAKLMNLINFNKEKGRYTITKTELGKIIENEDLYFLENISKLVCSYFLTSKLYGAQIWCEVVRNMSSKYGNTIKENIVLKELEDLFNVNINLTPFRSCYNSEKSLLSLGLVNIEEVDGENLIVFNKNKYYDENIYVYGYTLIKELEAIDSNRKEFTIDEIFEDIKWQKGYCWDEDIAMNILEKLNDLNIISLNRQLNPITIIINVNSEEIVDEIYSFLI